MDLPKSWFMCDILEIFMTDVIIIIVSVGLVDGFIIYVHLLSKTSFGMLWATTAITQRIQKIFVE